RCPASLCRIGGGDAFFLRFGQADPDIELERIAERLPPVLAHGVRGKAAHKSIEEKSERARVIPMRGPGRPKWRLLFQGRDDRGIVENVHRRVERAQSSLAGE